jgi:hypothetical protein
MRQRNFASLFAALVSAIALAPLALHAALLQTVYDDTVGPLGGEFGTPFLGPGCCYTGNEIGLAGQARRVVLLSVPVSSQGQDVLSSFDTRIYANNGAGGSPGTLLWDSGLLLYHVLPIDRLIDIAVPGVVVPDVITVVSRIETSTPVALGRWEPGPPAVGVFERAWLLNEAGEWHPGFAHAMRLVASVPEPASVFLVAAALLAMVGARRRGVERPRVETADQPPTSRCHA